MSKYSPEYSVRAHKKPLNIKAIYKAIRNREILDNKVIGCTNDRTLKLILGSNIQGLIPSDELEYDITGSREGRPNLAVSKVGKTVKFIPMSVEKQEDGSYIVKCSRKEAQKECYNKYISRLLPGDIIDANIIRTVKYGAFCDIGCGVIALLPTNYLSVTHILDIDEALKGMTRIRAVVHSIDEYGRVKLTHRELLGTWEEEASKFQIGDIVQGTALSVESYGIFVRLSQNLSGLADKPNFDITAGDLISCKISSIKEDSMKIKLIVLNKIEYEEDKEGTIHEEFLDRFNYYIKGGHINEWVYSTKDAPKLIKTEFKTIKIYTETTGQETSKEVQDDTEIENTTENN